MKTKEKNYDRILVALIGALTCFVLLFIDLITKAMAQSAAGDKDRTVLTDYFLNLVRLEYMQNDGIAYSMFGGNETAMVVITLLTVVMIVVIAAVYFTVFKNNKPVRIVLAIIEAGAVGNLIDRLAFRYVRDFIDISKIGFGVANVADFYVVLGAVAFVFILAFIGPDALFPLKKEWREQAKLKNAEKEKAMNEGVHDENDLSND